MAQAWIRCKRCKTMVRFGKEKWIKKDPVCADCYGKLRGFTDERDDEEGGSGRGETR